MPLNTPADVLRHGLADSYDAVLHVLALLDQIETSTEHDATRDRIRHHRDETRRQIDNLERCFELLGTSPPRVSSGVVRALTDARQSLHKDTPLSALARETLDLDTTIRLEHYLAACFRTLAARARAIGNDDVVRLLEHNLRQEEEMARWAEERHARLLADAHAMR